MTVIEQWRSNADLYQKECGSSIGFTVDKPTTYEEFLSINSRWHAAMAKVIFPAKNILPPNAEIFFFLGVIFPANFLTNSR
jgi:hypothetical protein